jgi:hypothetical protein
MKTVYVVGRERYDDEMRAIRALERELKEIIVSIEWLDITTVEEAVSMRVLTVETVATYGSESART